MGFLWRRSQPRFTAGLAGSVSLWGTFRVGKGTFSLSGSVGASSSSSLIL